MRKIFAALICAVTAAVLLLNSITACADEEKTKEHTYCCAVAEMTTGTIISGTNKFTKVPVGTMNKLMTVLLAAEAIERGELSSNTIVKATSAVNGTKGAVIWLVAGEEMPLGDLLKGIIIGNANDASVAVAAAVAGNEEKFVEMMNKRAAELGMKNTSFTNCSGNYDDEKQISSAADLARLACELYKHKCVSDYFTVRLDYLRDGATELVSTNKLIGKYDGLVGFKAGFTENAGRCIVAAAERGDEAFAAVIVGADDEDAAAYEAKMMLNSAFAGYTVTKPKLPRNCPEKIEVKKSYSRMLALKYDEPNAAVIPEGTAGDVKGEIILPSFIYAPVKVGDKVGEIHFYRNNKFIFSSDIISAENAEKTNILNSLAILLKYVIKI